MNGSISGIGQSGSIPLESAKPIEADEGQQDAAINLFENLTQELTSLASETRLGGEKE